MFGERGCGKSSLWNAVLQPPPMGADLALAHNLRLLPTRAFGTCSAVAVEVSRSDCDKFSIEYFFDEDFMEQITLPAGERPEGDRIQVRTLEFFIQASFVPC